MQVLGILPVLAVARVREVHIVCSPETTALMQTCNKSMYKSDTDYNACDYQDCVCSGSLFPEDGMACEVRRKGSASWRPIGRFPSYKIKMANKAKIPVTDTWESHKLTLNSAVQGRGEVSAYRVFRESGVPASETASIGVTFNGGPMRTYVLVETVSDKAFMRKHFGHEDDEGNAWCLWDDTGEEKEGKCDNINMTSIIDIGTHIRFDRDALIKFYNAEIRTNHVDGACWGSNTNNFYLVEHNGVYQLVPWGLDQTMRCLKTSFEQPSCGPMRSLLASNASISVVTPLKCERDEPGKPDWVPVAYVVPLAMLAL